MAKRTVLNEFKKFLLPTAADGPLKILIVSPEATPYANVGGISRVVGSLSRAFLELGHDVRVFMPKFGLIDEEKYEMETVLEGLKVPTGADGQGEDVLICNVKTHQVPGGPLVYFLENMEYYEKRANVYGYSDDPLRWALLCRGCLEFLGKSDWTPHVIQTNDWQTGAIPNLLKTVYTKDKKFIFLSTLFTIHNLNYQGMFDHRTISEMDFDDGRSPIASFFSERLGKQNFVRRGIIYADVVNTVSETYAREILTPEYGEGLDKLLLEMRSKLFGVMNGIDYDEFNPQTDKLIPQNFGINTIERRIENKLALQREFDLPEGEGIPVLALVGRLDEMKGLDLAAEVLWPLLKSFDVQFIILGGGGARYIKIFQKLQKDFPKKVGTHLMPNFTLPRLIFAGADLMLFPSRFEPCGIVQLEAMRYGAIPVARATGGLADTIEDYDPRAQTGYGFLFKDFDKWQFFAQIVRALEVYNHKKDWLGLVERAMKADFSWGASAKKYVELYQKAIHFHRQELIANGQLAPEE